MTDTHPFIQCFAQWESYQKSVHAEIRSPLVIYHQKPELHIRRLRQHELGNKSCKSDCTFPFHIQHWSLLGRNGVAPTLSIYLNHRLLTIWSQVSTVSKTWSRKRHPLKALSKPYLFALEKKPKPNRKKTPKHIFCLLMEKLQNLGNSSRHTWRREQTEP